MTDVDNLLEKDDLVKYFNKVLDNYDNVDCLILNWEDEKGIHSRRLGRPTELIGLQKICEIMLLDETCDADPIDESED